MRDDGRALPDCRDRLHDELAFNSVIPPVTMRSPMMRVVPPTFNAVASSITVAPVKPIPTWGMRVPFWTRISSWAMFAKPMVWKT